MLGSWKGNNLNGLLSLLPESMALEYDKRLKLIFEICKSINRVSSMIHRGVMSAEALTEEAEHIAGKSVIQVTELIRLDTQVTIFLNYDNKKLSLATRSLYGNKQVICYEELIMEDLVSLMPSTGKICWSLAEIEQILSSIQSISNQKK